MLKKNKMDDKIEYLNREIVILNERISILERQNNRLKAYRKIKTVFNILIVGIVIYAIWYGYDYIANYIPNKISQTVNGLIPESFR